MISRYTEKNEFGGYTWQIKNSSTVRVHIKGTSKPCEYTIEIQEFGWVRWSTKKSRISKKSLADTIEEAFELLYDFFDTHDDFNVSRSLMPKELKHTLDGLEKSDFYTNEIAPLEEKC